MNEEYLIEKWLSDELTASEEKAFKALDDYEMHVKILETAHFFKASDVSEVATLDSFYAKIDKKNRPVDRDKVWYKPFLKIAAMLVILLGVGSLFFLNTKTSVNSLVSEKISLELPDDSVVKLNSKSEIVFDKNNWKDKREVILDGEAFFTVSKGSSFNVITDNGKVSVLGTQFNVKNRKGYFEVQCFHGLVSVQYGEHAKKLPAGSTFKVVNGLVTSGVVSEMEPQWINNVSSFKSVPFYEVIKEFERQYDVVFTIDNIDTSRIFTGGFVHTSLEDGLKSITLPLDLEYSIDSNKYITLYNSKL